MPDRVTREGVEIARVGTYRLSTGPHTFTREQLAAAVENADGAAQGIRLGIGHIDPRFNAPGQDGDPAFGRVVNLRLAEGGELLLGDYADVPEWLAESMDVAYPGRSLEGTARGDDLHISTVKLLGTEPPGITTLKDLELAIAASGDDGIEARIVTGNIREARALAEHVDRVPADEPSTQPKEHASMDPTILREKLGLAEDASDEDVTTKLDEFASRPTPEAVEETVAEAVAAAAAPPADDDTVKLDPETYADLKAAAESGRAALTIIRERDRDGKIDKAISAGKFPPSRRDHYVKRWESDPEGTEAEIEALESGVVPVEEIGASSASDDEGGLVTTGMFPHLDKED